MMTASTTEQREHQCEDEEYASFLATIRRALDDAPTGTRLFTTDATGLFEAFLAGIPSDRRGHYTCRTCRHFIERFGGIAMIDEFGNAASPIWWHTDPWPSFFAASVKAMVHLVAKARVTGLFLSDEARLGVESNVSPKSPDGRWFHMNLVLRPDMVHKPNALASTSQVMAAKREEHGMLERGLHEFPLAVATQAHTLLTTDVLHQSEKCAGVAKWFLDLHQARLSTKNARAKENLAWRAVASAPEGWCHIRTTMIGTLLEDIAAAKPTSDVIRSFNAKMAPLEYRRPKAAPSDGQLAAAEKSIAKLASAGALARRYATLDDVLPFAIWSPKPDRGSAPASGSVFGHLKTKRADPPPLDIPPQTMTWAKFSTTILSAAERIEFLVPRSVSSFFAFVTAVDMSAPPILQWDHEDRRNPVSPYVYHQGSLASTWALDAGTYCDVVAVTPSPAHFHPPGLQHHAPGVHFVLRGAHDINAGNRGLGLALFPAVLRSEYHGISAAIEAFSNAGTLAGAAEATACGYCFSAGSSAWTMNQVFRVTASGTTLLYRIDRWD